jgi:hypothetical protein
MKRFTIHFLTKGLVVGALVMLPACLFGQLRPESPQPDARYHVDKQYDEQGNLLRYDSVYTWSWSSEGQPINPDSLMRAFRQQFGWSDQAEAFRGFPKDFESDFFQALPALPFFDHRDLSRDSSLFSPWGNPLPSDSLWRHFPFHDMDEQFRRLLEQHRQMLIPFEQGPGPLPRPQPQARPREIRI